jgi:hypothetical protein
VLLAGCSSVGATPGNSSGRVGLSTTSGATSSGAGSGSTGTNMGTATGGSSTGGTSGGLNGGSSTGAGCLPTPDGGPSPYIGANCTGSDTCCGLACTFSGGLGNCEPSCATTADCPLSYTVCAAGECTTALCGRSDGGGFNGPCNLEDAGDGNCVAGEIVALDGGYLGLCVQSGTAATNDPCDGNALRTEPSLLCASGDVCSSSDGNPRCFQNCNVLAQDAGCPAGTTCQPYWEGGNGFTACF